MLRAFFDGAGSLEGRVRPVLFHELESPVIERCAGGRFNLHDPLATATPQKFERAVMAIRIVPPLAEERMRRPGAAAHAIVRVVAILAVSPQLARRAIAREAKGLGA